MTAFSLTENMRQVLPARALGDLVKAQDQTRHADLIAQRQSEPAMPFSIQLTVSKDRSPGFQSQRHRRAAGLLNGLVNLAQQLALVEIMENIAQKRAGQAKPKAASGQFDQRDMPQCAAKLSRINIPAVRNVLTA